MNNQSSRPRGWASAAARPARSGDALGSRPLSIGNLGIRIAAGQIDALGELAANQRKQRASNRPVIVLSASENGESA